MLRADVEELKIALEDTNISQVGENEFIRIKGVSDDCTEREVAAFLDGLRIAPDGIIFPLDQRYRRTQNCFVRLESVEDAKKARQLDGKTFLGSRLVSMFSAFQAVFSSNFSKVT